jgi:hypothetical protein
LKLTEFQFETFYFESNLNFTLHTKSFCGNYSFSDNNESVNENIDLNKRSERYTEKIICGIVGFFLSCVGFFYMPIIGHVMWYYWLYCVVE